MKITELIRLYPGDRVEITHPGGKVGHVRIVRGLVYGQAHALKKSDNPGGYVGEAWALHERDDTKKPAKKKAGKR